MLVYGIFWWSVSRGRLAGNVPSPGGARNGWKPPRVTSARLRQKVAAPKECLQPSIYLPTAPGICDFDLFEDVEYLPDATFLEASIAAAHLAWRDDSEKLHKRWSSLQNPPDCNMPSSNDHTMPDYKVVDRATGKRVPRAPRKGTPKWHLVRFLAHGYGYNVYMMGLNAGAHWASGVPVLASNSNYRYNGGGECGKGWSCYLSPLSKCRLHDDVRSDSVLVYTKESSKLAYTLAGVCGPGGTLSEEWGRCVCKRGFVPDNNYPRYFHCIPSQLYEKEGKMHYAKEYHSFRNDEALKTAATQHRWFKKSPGEENPQGISDPFANIRETAPSSLRQHGLVWWMGHVLWHLHRDAPARRTIEDAPSWGLGKCNNCIALHVRRGDACRDKVQRHKRCPEWSEYLSKVQTMVDMYGPFDDVYLATDSDKVVREARESFERSMKGVKLVTQPMSREMFQNIDSVDWSEEVNDPQRVREIASDIWAMSVSRICWYVHFFHIMGRYSMMVALEATILPSYPLICPFFTKETWADFLKSKRSDHE